MSGLPPATSTSSFWHTEPCARLLGHRSTEGLPNEADVVIIGSGITGTSAAWHLLTERHDSLEIVMLEAREACWGATGRNGGHCQPVLFEHPEDPSIGFFELDNLKQMRALISRLSIPCEFAVQPSCRAIYSQHRLDATEAALRVLAKTAPDQRQRIKLIKDRARLAELRIPTAKAAVVTDVAARFWPYKFVAFLLERLVDDTSFNLQTLTPAESLQPHADGHRWQVTTPRGIIVAKKIIIATNAYTAHLVPAFKPLIVPCRGQMSALMPPASISGENRLRMSFEFLGDGLDDYLIQRPNEAGGHLMLGGGRHAGAHCMGTIDDSVIDDFTAEYLRACPAAALGLDSKLDAFAEWTGIMGYSRDEHPWVGPIQLGDSDRPSAGLFVAAGYTGNGMCNAWLCGKAVAMMAVDPASAPGEMVAKVAAQVKLPTSYLVTRVRILRALSLESVEARELAERRRGGCRNDVYVHSAASL